LQHETRFLPLLIIGLGRASFLGRGKARSFLLKLLNRIGTNYVRTTYRGVPFLFHLDNPTERRALFGRYDDQELNFLLDVMQEPGNVFIDIGANSGFYTNNILGRSGVGTTILAVEPNPIMIERLRANAALLDANMSEGKNLLVAQKALSATRTQAFLNLDAGFGSAHITDPQAQKTLRVETMPLQDLLDENQISRIDALKIDVEGHEDRVLGPFLDKAPEKLLPRRIVIEYTSKNQWRSDILERLLQTGYICVKKTRGNALLARSS